MADRLLENLAAVRGRIAAAAARSGRRAEDVTLVAVTKYAGDQVARALVQRGALDLGESRPQELWKKAAALADLAKPPRWHLVGHLQRNKVERTVPLVSLVHSADSVRLLEALDNTARGIQRRVPVLLEVNVSGEAAKHGFAPAELSALRAMLDERAHLEVRGLMAMAGLEGDAADARREFAALRELRDRLRREWGNEYPLPELSMGMSGDYEIAIEEGATLVRVGSALFERVTRE